MQLLKKKYSGIVLIFIVHVFSFNSLYAQEAKLMFTFGHTGKVTYALFSPDGKKIVTASMDKTGKIWDALTGNVLADLKGNKNIIYSEEFSPDGKKIVTTSFDSTARVWDINSGELLLDLKGHTNEVWGAHFSKDGKKIATCSEDSTAKIWDAQTGKPLISLIGHTGFIQNICFSPDGEKVATASYDSTVRIWDAKNGSTLQILNLHKGFVYSAQFSNNGRYLVTASADSSAKLWEVSSGKLLANLCGHNHQVWIAEFSSDDKQIVTASFDGVAKLWNGITGKLLFDLKEHKGAIWHAKFSPDNKKLVTASDDQTVKIWDVTTGHILVDIPAHNAQVRTAYFSPDGKKVISASDDKTAKVWDANTGELLLDLRGYASGLWSVKISPDGKKILTASGDNTAKLWDIKQGKILYELKGHTDTVSISLFSPDGKKIITTSYDKTAKLWDAGNGNLLSDLKGHTKKITAVEYSSNGKLVATGSDDSTIRIWNADNGVLVCNQRDHAAGISSIQFSHDGKKIVSTSKDGIAKIWDVASCKIINSIIVTNYLLEPFKRVTAEFNPADTKLVTVAGIQDFATIWDVTTGKQLAKLIGHKERISTAKFSPDGKKIITASYDHTAKIWDAETGALLKTINGHSFGLKSAEFIENGNKIITSSRDNSSKIWDAASDSLLTTFTPRTTASWLNGEVESSNFANNGELIVTSSGKTSINIWDAKKGELFYTFFTIGKSGDYLVIDKDGHYDGTESARKLLYFTCGTEVISTDQVKEQLWVPDLADRIMRKDSITDTKLSELDICSYTPEVEKLDKGMNDFRFKITPRKGGLGETVLYLNGIEVKKYQPAELQKKGNAYFLSVKEDDLEDKYVSNIENRLMVRSFAAKKNISSRGVIVTENYKRKDSTPPNLYAIMIGVSKYKGDDLTLTFPAKDANDLSIALDVSAAKLFGSSHVHIYDLTTNPLHYRNPGKKSIRQTIEDISKVSRPNDVLLIFFAGHGKTASANKKEDKKRFYFLTADASAATIDEAIAEVGISTEELTTWINPSVMKAQKRVLIFDACNSGQVINDIQSKPENFNARNDDKTQQIRAIDKLNEQSGFFILSASASDQSAYEMNKYGHGLLTYALLKAIKQNPDILQPGGFLDVSRWFNAGRDAVSDLSKSTGARQQPQLMSNTNFSIGKVDEEVIASIKLSKENPVFASCSFRNDVDSIADDDLDFEKYVNQQLNDIASRGPGDDIIYFSGSKDPEAWTLSGKYVVQGDNLFVKTINLRQKKQTKYSFQATGKMSDLNALAAEIVAKAMEWILRNKAN